MIKIRQDLNKMPEESFKEIRTSKYIKERLDSLGFETEIVAETGVVGFKKGSTDKKAIAFRADMDAIETEYGLAHACGHDGHMAILLGFANVLSQAKDLKRDVLLIFQPAEEKHGGAEVIVKEGILKKYNIESIFGLHIMPEIEEGKIGLNHGPIMARCGKFKVIVNAKGGHGAMPHKCTDGIYISAQLINLYQSIVSRNIDPLESVVLSIGKIQGGKAENIIAETVILEGIVRAYTDNVYNYTKERIQKINKSIENMFDINIEMNFEDMYPAVVNDFKLYELIKESFKDEEDKIVVNEPMMISEDFSYYQKEVPGLFFMLGSKNEQLGYTKPLHNIDFNFSPKVLGNGLNAYIKIGKTLGII